MLQKNILHQLPCYNVDYVTMVKLIFITVVYFVRMVYFTLITLLGFYNMLLYHYYSGN